VKKIIIIFIAVFSCVFISCTSVDKNVYFKDSSLKRKGIRIAVLPFKDAHGKKGSGLKISDAIANEIIKVPNWVPIERTQLSNIVKEKSLDATGLTDSDYENISRLNRADYIIVGSVSEFSYRRKYCIVPSTRLAFNARIIDAKTGAIKGTAHYNLESGKNAWLGCCLLSWYYIPVALLSDKNINDDVNRAAEEIVTKIKRSL